MLFRRPSLDGIRAGEITLAFRRWDRPRARAGGRQRTLVGDRSALVTQLEGAAWITGEHTFLLDEDDPLEVGSL